MLFCKLAIAVVYLFRRGSRIVFIDFDFCNPALAWAGKAVKNPQPWILARDPAMWLPPRSVLRSASFSAS